MITRESKLVKVEGHVGTWHTIDSGVFVLTPDTDDGRPLTIRKRLFLMEHEEYGDEAACVIVDEDGTLVLEDVWNGYDDLEGAGWERIAEHECPICGKDFPRDEMRFTRDCRGITFRLVCMDCWEQAMKRGYDGEYYTEADECIEGDY